MNVKETVRILAEALPYLRQFRNCAVVIKYGGNAMANAELSSDFERDVVLLESLGIHPIVVHGGGPMITQRLNEKNIQSQFVQGIRITDDRVMAEVEKVICDVNAQICAGIRRHGGEALGLTTGDDLRVKRMPPLGRERISPQRVGAVQTVSAELKDAAARPNIIPVVAPLGRDADGVLCNINADLAAQAVAISLNADKLILMTNTRGVLDSEQQLVSKISYEQVRDLIESEVVNGGMLPKILCAAEAARAGVPATHIIDGRVEHALLLELLTREGVGTLIEK